MTNLQFKVPIPLLYRNVLPLLDEKLKQSVFGKYAEFRDRKINSLQLQNFFVQNVPVSAIAEALGKMFPSSNIQDKIRTEFVQETESKIKNYDNCSETDKDNILNYIYGCLPHFIM